MFPLGTVFVPGDMVTLRVFEHRYVEMIRSLLASDSDTLEFGTVLIDKGSEVGGKDLRRTVGVNVVVKQCEVSDTGGYLVAGVATQRLEVCEWRIDDPFPIADVTCPPVEQASDMSVSRLSRVAQMVRSLLVLMLEEASSSVTDARKIGGEDALDEYLPPNISAPLAHVAAGLIEPSESDAASWAVIRAVPCGPFDKYSLLAAPTLEERLTQTEQVVSHLREMVEFRRQ